MCGSPWVGPYGQAVSLVPSFNHDLQHHRLASLEANYQVNAQGHYVPKPIGGGNPQTEGKGKDGKAAAGRVCSRLYNPKPIFPSVVRDGARGTTVTVLQGSELLLSPDIENPDVQAELPIEHNYNRMPADQRRLSCRDSKLQKSPAYAQKGVSDLNKLQARAESLELAFTIASGQQRQA